MSMGGRGSSKKRAVTHLYGVTAQWGKLERAAMKFLRRYLDEKEPTLKDFAKVAREFEQRARLFRPEPMGDCQRL